MTRSRTSYSLFFLVGLALIGVVFIGRGEDLSLTQPAEAGDGPGSFKGKHRPRPQVQVMHPYRDTIDRMTRAVAHVEPIREAMVYGMVTGRVLVDPIEEGTRIEAGATLCTLHVPDLVAAHATAASRVLEANAHVAEAEANGIQAAQDKRQAEAMVLQAEGGVAIAMADQTQVAAKLRYRKTVFERLEAVLKSSPNLIAQDKVDEAAGNLAIAEAELAGSRVAVTGARIGVDLAVANVASAAARVQAAAARKAASIAQAKVAANAAAEAKVRVDWATVTSPIKGVVAKRMVDTGSLVKDGARNSGAEPLFHVVNDDKLRVWFALATPDAPHCRIGNQVTLIFEELRDPKTGEKPYRIKTTVKRITDALDVATRTMKAEVVLTNPMDAKKQKMLRAGMFCRVEVMLESYPNALILPTRAVATRKHKSSVLVVRTGEDNVVRKISVKIGVDDGRRIQILDDGSITDSDLIIIKGGGLAADGEKVVPHEVPPPSKSGDVR